MPIVNNVYCQSHNPANVSVSSTAVLISAARTGRRLYCQPNGSVDVWIGGPTVTVGQGILLSHSSSPPTLFSDLESSADWWAISASSTTLFVDQIY